MTAHSFLPLALSAFALTLLHAEDMRKVPPMTYEGPADVELKGREFEAMEVALSSISESAVLYVWGSPTLHDRAAPPGRKSRCIILFLAR
jgi:hypothetical protein